MTTTTLALTNRTQQVTTNNSGVCSHTHTTRFTYNNKWRVIVSTSRYKTAKEIRTTLSLVEYEQRDNGISVEKSIGNIFDYWFSNCIEIIPCARYSERTFALAVESGLTKFFNEYQNEYENQIVQILTTGTYTIK